MTTLEPWRVAVGATVGAVLALAASCTVPAPDPGDTTPPTVLFTVSWARPGTPDAGSIGVLTLDEHRDLHRDSVVRVQVLGSDPESGIRTVRITGHLVKDCTVGGDLAQNKRLAVLVREPRTAPSTAPGSVGAGFTAAIGDLGCPGPTLSAGGDLRAEVENLAGATTTSAEFTWAWRIS